MVWALGKEADGSAVTLVLGAFLGFLEEAMDQPSCWIGLGLGGALDEAASE